MGYGIEGAVGSSYKIDARQRLESATRQFGVSILLSGLVYKCLTENMKRICSFVDHVKVKGSELPLDLYTVDVNF